jgi:hypothetical protein
VRFDCILKAAMPYEIACIVKVVIGEYFAVESDPLFKISSQFL